MKFFRNIFALALILVFVASCTKEVIKPAGNTDITTKKNGEVGGNNTFDGQNGDIDVNDDGYSDGDITDPENDLDFD